MKKFCYFENQDGGMGVYEMSSKEQMPRLYGWMKEGWCKEEDEAMLKWMDTAEVGEDFEHRLGIMVRLKDFEDLL